MRHQNRSRLLYPATVVGGGRIGHRRLIPQRRRSIWDIVIGRRYDFEARARSWSRPRRSPPSALNSARLQSDSWIQAEDYPADSRYYQEVIDLREDSILSDDLLEVLSRPLAGGPIRPRHAFATSRLTSRPARNHQAKTPQVRRIKVD